MCVKCPSYCRAQTQPDLCCCTAQPTFNWIARNATQHRMRDKCRRYNLCLMCTSCRACGYYIKSKVGLLECIIAERPHMHNINVYEKGSNARNTKR